MWKHFYPKERKNSIYDISWEMWRDMQMEGVVFDVDNTLVPHGAPADERVIALFAHLRELGMKTCLLSNNKEPRVCSFAGQVSSPYIYKAGKPSVKNYYKAMEIMGTTPRATMFVGDQLFTDIYGANRVGIYGILVKPMNPREEIQIVLKRYLEAPILRSYEKSQKRENRK